MVAAAAKSRVQLPKSLFPNLSAPASASKQKAQPTTLGKFFGRREVSPFFNNFRRKAVLCGACHLEFVEDIQE
jgi:hypothetical protein